MHLVPRAEWHPGYCAITGRGEDPDGFIDTGNTLRCIDPKILVSVAGAKQLATFIGWSDPETVEQLESRIVELESDNEDLLAHKEKAEQVYGSIQTLENHGFGINLKEEVA